MDLLGRYFGVFEWKHGLPPKRDQQHTIRIKEGVESNSVRHYHYSHSQKIEIQMLLSEILQARIIQISQIPFSSLMLLVKKKDGS